MLKRVRQELIASLLQRYREHTLQMQLIETGLIKKGLQFFPIDHFAVIDLPSPHTGIPVLKEIFSSLGYEERGKDYLPEKQNDFLWLAETSCYTLPAQEALPQVVVADFRLHELPSTVRTIIEKYAAQSTASPLETVKRLALQVQHGDASAVHELVTLLQQYFQGRDWPLPSVSEFKTVHAFNELLAWVLVFGRRPNHFTLAIHHLHHFTDMQTFIAFIETELQLPLNHEGGKIKGDKTTGIVQGSTKGTTQTVALSDGEVQLPTGFVEFVWRFPLDLNCHNPILWQDYFSGFIPRHADQVIESLYLPQKKDILCKVQG